MFVVLENDCVTKPGGSGHKGGAIVMNCTPTQACVSIFNTSANPLKGMVPWH